MILSAGSSQKENRRQYSPNEEIPTLFKRPSIQSLGFPMPMSFLQNFKDNVDWKKYIPNRLDNLEEGNRVKRSTLDETQLRNAMIAAILQRQLIMAEDHRAGGLFSHGGPPHSPPAHHVSSLNVPSPLRAHDVLVPQHDSHHSVHISTANHHVSHGVSHGLQADIVHQDTQQVFPAHHAAPHATPHAPLAHLNEVHHTTKGYAPPIKGGLLEDVFGVSSKYYSPARPDYNVQESAYQAPGPSYVAPAAAYHPPEPAYHPPEPAYSPPAPAYHPPEPKYSPEPIYHPGPKYSPPEPSYAPEPKYSLPEPVHVLEPKYSPPEPAYHAPEPAYHAPEPAYHAPEPAYHTPRPAGSYKPPSYHGHPFSMEMVFGLPMHNHYMTKYAHLLPEHMHVPSPDRVYITPQPKYHEPTPVYHEPSPAYQEPKPEPAYVAPKKVGYDLPSHGGSLEDVFGVASKYSPAKYDAPAPDYAPPAYQPNLLPAHGYEPEHNSYTLHYLPYEDYVPVHAEALAVKAKVPSIPGTAHILVKSPHPHVGDFRHVTAAPNLHFPPSQLQLSNPHHG
jgi:hypothetical protein